MTEKKQMKNGVLTLMRADITDIEVDSFVFYAQDDLKLSSGFGNSIAMRGGPTVRKELAEIGPVKVTDVVATSGGNMKAKFIIHADGPKFQEEDTEKKLKMTIGNSLKCAEEKGVDSIAFPPMGAGFYGVPIDRSAEITTETLALYLNNGVKIKNIIICANDNREYKALQKQFNNLKLMGSFKDKKNGTGPMNDKGGKQ
ncbi:MAG: macro domain-containing protein [Nitrospirota bacterium]